MKAMTAAEVKGFLARDWARSRRSKDAAIGRRTRRDGAQAAFALAQTLLAAVWPRINEPAARAADLEGHLTLREKLRRAATLHR